jgi:ubiquinone/menaquinone biosynthesis C-methylase UbiE
MNHKDHVDLLQGGIRPLGGLWADLGAGTGAFTLALAELLGSAGHIYAVDKDRRALRQLEKTMQAQFPATAIHVEAADFTQRLNLPPLDGVIMANSLHFQRNKKRLVETVRNYLRPGGRLVLVEYDTDRGNRWVPYPLAYPSWQMLAAQAGFADTRLLATKPSRFLGRIYSAVSR